MSFMTIYERAPIGALIAWTDGTRCPPKRTSTLHSEWLFHNNLGRLVKTQGERGSGDPGLCPAITILKGDFYTFQSTIRFGSRSLNGRRLAPFGSSTDRVTTLSLSISHAAASRQSIGPWSREIAIPIPSSRK